MMDINTLRDELAILCFAAELGDSMQVAVVSERIIAGVALRTMRATA